MIFNLRALVLISATAALGAADDYPCTGMFVQSGDGCAKLAQTCNISENTFNQYNPSCPSIQVGQLVCCTKPSFTANADGTCHVHTQSGSQYCSDIAGMYGITNDNIEEWNAGTFGWKGCAFLGQGMKVCVSPGTPPRPTPDPDAECGPLAPGDKYNSECPLKACCSQFGYCGLTSEFCAKKDSTTGAPGTTGCLSNCDIEFVKSGPPSQFISVGYYESWNQGWPCLKSNVDELNLDKYTHVHFSFADIDASLQPTLDTFATAQWSRFKKISKRKIVSFGGWGISTDPSTYVNLRNMVQPANRATAAQNLVNFMTSNGLDGIDIDWEYPGAPDIPGIPAGQPDDGANYLAFLKEVRNRLPQGKTLSMAAPASYWYLKSFPIAEMSAVVDYIVFMTYDLHGQWDHDNQYTGPYLMSHVNWTETTSMLNLITHAGVPGNKVLLGLAAYGRSFQQSDPSCSGPNCTFTGTTSLSKATPGPCTGTAGYLALAEINRIRGTNRMRDEYVDADSQIMLYDTDQWVAFNTPEQLDKREQLAINMNLGGTVMWAIDISDDNGGLAADPCDVKSLTHDEFIESSCPNKGPALISWIDEVVQDLRSLDNATLIRLQLNPSQRIEQLLDIKATFLSQTSVTKRDISLDIAGGAQAITENAANYAGLVKNNLYSIVADPSQAARTIESLVLADMAKLHLRKNQVLVAIAVATLAAPTIGGISFAGSALIYISFEALQRWNKQYVWFFNKGTTLEDELDDYVSEAEIIKEVIADKLDLEVEDAANDPGPTQRTSTIIISPLATNTCPNTAILTQTQVHSAITGNYRTVTRSWEEDDDGNKRCVLPVYYINREGHSLGVACNAYKYMFNRRAFIYSRGLPSTNSDRKPKRFQLQMHNGCPLEHDVRVSGRIGNPYYNTVNSLQRDGRDEFPMNAMYEGYRKERLDTGTVIHTYDTSILCIPWYENMADGLVYWRQFLDARPPYNKCDPNDDESPERGPITFARSETDRSYFIVQALIGGSFNDVCFQNQQTYRVPGFENPPRMDTTVTPFRYRVKANDPAVLVTNEFQDRF